MHKKESEWRDPSSSKSIRWHHAVFLPSSTDPRRQYSISPGQVGLRRNRDRNRRVQRLKTKFAARQKNNPTTSFVPLGERVVVPPSRESRVRGSSRLFSGAERHGFGPTPLCGLNSSG